MREFCLRGAGYCTSDTLGIWGLFSRQDLNVGGFTTRNEEGAAWPGCSASGGIRVESGGTGLTMPG